MIPSAGTIDDTHARQSAKLAQHDDTAAVATRVIARGGGSTAVLDAAIGQASLPIDDPVWYLPAGGLVECGPQRLTYTGVVGASEQGSTMGKVATPPANANYWAPGGNGTGTFQAGNRWVGVTNVTANGETAVGPLTLVTFGPNSNLMIGVSNALHPPDNTPTDPSIKAFRAYVGTSGGGPETLQMVKYVGFSTNWVNSYGFRWDNPDGYNLCGGPSGLDGTIQPPAVSTAGDSSTVVPAGSTTLPVDDLSLFPAAGWVVVPGDQVIRYTGKSATSGPGTLTGIPASGIGSITAPVKAGTVKVQPHLTGIPASGAGAIVYAIKGGDAVYVVVIREDAAAIAALASATGGDGIREEFLTDGRLAIPELTARADATLLMRKQSLVTVNFESRDPLVTVGKTITFNTTLPPIVGTFLIQRVTISQFQARGSIGHPDPLRVVEASSRRYTFDDLVQQIKLLGRIKLMVLNPAWFNALVDDNTGTTGTVWDKATIKGLTDTIDAEFGRIDYVSALWTPTIGSVGGGTPSYTRQAGAYAKVAQHLCWATFDVVFTKGTLGAGGLTLSLPFPATHLGIQFGGAPITLFSGLAVAASGVCSYLRRRQHLCCCPGMAGRHTTFDDGGAAQDRRVSGFWYIV